jgi:pyruvate-formate lyase
MDVLLTPRVERLRSRLHGLRPQVLEGVAAPRSGPVYHGSEPFHEEWMRHEGEPFRLRLALAEAAWRSAVRPRLVPGHLVLGTPPPVCVVSYRTGVFAWDIVIDEKLAAAHPETTEVVAFWRRWLAERPRPELPVDLSDPGVRGALMLHCPGAHSVLAYDLLLGPGLPGLRTRVVEARSRDLERSAWYESLLVCIDGVRGYILAHAEACERAAAAEPDPAQRSEWHTLEADCRAIADHPAATFQQAVQLFELVFLLSGHDSPGRIDQYLWPALERDLAAGTVSLEAAQEIVDCLYLKLAEHICYGATLGGQLPEGGDATNPLTRLALASIRRLRVLSPRTALRWHRGTPPDLYREAIRSVAEGATFPTLVNDEAMIPSLLRRGVREEHARDYTFCGCSQTIPQGRAYGGYEDVMLNSAKPLCLALHDGRDEKTGEQAGPRTGRAEELRSYEELEQAVWLQLERVLRAGIGIVNATRAWAAVHFPDPLRSLLTHSCVERGLDWRAGGADYHEGMVDAVGFATLADSLSAVRALVYEEKRLSLAELRDVLDRDWTGEEALRAWCARSAPKWGNDDPAADETEVRWLTRLNDWLFEQPTWRGGHWGLDIVGWSGAVAFGKDTGATPDGRRSGEPLADSGGPAQGRDRAGVTAVFRSMEKLPMRAIHGPITLNLRFPGSLLRRADAQEKLGALLATYLGRGGQQVQVSAAGAEEMRRAQRDPERHRDLIVRVGGFSAYFVDLEPDYQEDMIRRTEHAV